MRSQLLDQIHALAVNSLRVSNELPYDESGTPRYVKNPRTIFVDRDTIDSSPLFATLDASVDITTETTSVSVFFTTDAKNPPSSLESTIQDLRQLRNLIDSAGSNRRECLVSREYVGDLLVTELEYRLTKLA